MTHRELCAQAAKWLLEQQNIDLVAYELRVKPFVFDCIGITSKSKCADRRYAVIEVKRTRADLLQDLRAGKMQKYAQKASHCYLAGTSEALGLDKHPKAQVLEDLSNRGLPANWGVLVFTGDTCKALRNPRRIRPVNVVTARAITRRIARSYMYRVLYGSFAESDVD